MAQGCVIRWIRRRKAQSVSRSTIADDFRRRATQTRVSRERAAESPPRSDRASERSRPNRPRSGAGATDPADIRRRPGHAQPGDDGRDDVCEFRRRPLDAGACCIWARFPIRKSGERRQDLLAAQQLIDIIGMLKEKTRGNLDQDEQSLLEAILFELRMKYVERARQAPR